MKVGDHAGESFEEILERKNKEYERCGRIFWGYGGASCHPLTQVQPFVHARAAAGGQLHLLMEPIESNADPDLMPAEEYSEDGVTWEPIPDGIEVTGSRYALVLGEIRPGELELSLNEFEIGVGPSRGRSAQDYLKGRIDKACLVRSPKPDIDKLEVPTREVKYVAELIDPHAVLLR